jgi:hypothetical protein
MEQRRQSLEDLFRDDVPGSAAPPPPVASIGGGKPA